MERCWVAATRAGLAIWATWLTGIRSCLSSSAWALLHSFFFSSSIQFSFRTSLRPFSCCSSLGYASLSCGFLCGSNLPDCIVPLEHKYHCQPPSLNIISVLADGCNTFFFPHNWRCHPHNPIITFLCLWWISTWLSFLPALQNAFPNPLPSSFIPAPPSIRMTETSGHMNLYTQWISIWIWMWLWMEVMV